MMMIGAIAAFAIAAAVAGPALHPGGRPPLQQVRCSSSHKRLSSADFVVAIKCDIPPGWRVAGLHSPDGGLSLQFHKHPLIELKGPTSEVGKLSKQTQPSTGQMETFHTGSFSLVQTARVKGGVPFVLTAVLRYAPVANGKPQPAVESVFAIQLK